MHLKKTKEGSQFYRFHSNSEVADGIPNIGGRRIDVLQVVYTGNERHNIMIEFKYI